MKIVLVPLHGREEKLILMLKDVSYINLCGTHFCLAFWLMTIFRFFFFLKTYLLNMNGWKTYKILPLYMFFCPTFPFHSSYFSKIPNQFNLALYVHGTLANNLFQREAMYSVVGKLMLTPLTILKIYLNKKVYRWIDSKIKRQI